MRRATTSIFQLPTTCRYNAHLAQKSVQIVALMQSSLPTRAIVLLQSMKQARRQQSSPLSSALHPNACATPYAGTAKQAATPLALELVIILYSALESLERCIAMLEKLQRSRIIASSRRPTCSRTTPTVQHTERRKMRVLPTSERLDGLGLQHLTLRNASSSVESIQISIGVESRFGSAMSAQ
jgi:hypothetical protein